MDDLGMEQLSTELLGQAVKDLGEMVEEQAPTNLPVAILMHLAMDLAAKELLVRSVGPALADRLWRERKGH